MKQLSPKELEQIISLYLDGELDDSERKSLEEYLNSHPVVKREIEILQSAQKALSSKEKLRKDDWFWLKLSNKLEQKESQSNGFIHGMRSVFALSGLTSMIILIVGIMYFKETSLFHRFFLEKKSFVEDVYHNNIMSGNILPLFSNLTKDDVLNFALFGNIAIDSANNTSLNVKSTEDKGSQIQIVKNVELPASPITIKDFAQEIGINSNQQEIVDSILGSYQEKLQASVLVSENDEVAIHTELVDLNRAMVSTIASCLEPVQRTRFQKFLDVRNAPYAVVTINSPRLESHVIWNKMTKVSNSHNYVIISPDTVEFAEMLINIDSIREVSRRQEMRFNKLMTQRMVAELTERQHRVEENSIGVGQNRVRIHSSSGAFQIHFQSPDAAIPSNDVEMVDMVRPRMVVPTAPRRTVNEVTVIGDSAFSFEIPADDQTVSVFKRLPKGEFRFEVVDSFVNGSRMKLMFKSPSTKRAFESKLREMKQQEHDLIDLDSLLRESDRQKFETPPSKQKSSKKEIEI
jgi:hypothetical protein